MIIAMYMKIDKNKKKYISPLVSQLAIAPQILLVVSGVLNGDDDYAEGDGSDQLSNEHRGSWDGIWDYME